MTQPQYHSELENHQHNHEGLKGFLLFGGLTASLGWTLYLVWLGLVGLAEEIRKIQG